MLVARDVGEQARLRCKAEAVEIEYSFMFDGVRFEFRFSQARSWARLGFEELRLEEAVEILVSREFRASHHAVV